MIIIDRLMQLSVQLVVRLDKFPLIMSYADGLAFISPSAVGLHLLLNVCELYGASLKEDCFTCI